jgi:hypothetical protein
MPKFTLGNIVATPGVLAAFQYAPDSYWPYLRRHNEGDWGEISSKDRVENELSLLEGFRLLSAYTTKSGIKIWIITERDRSSYNLAAK